MKNSLRLNIGCGNDLLEGYMNADINPNIKGLDLVCDLIDIPLPDNSMDEVLAKHCCEHVPFRVALKAIVEWRRVLRVGGTLRIDTPNLQRNAEIYLARNDQWMEDFRSFTRDEQMACTFNGKPNRTLVMNFKCFSSDAQYDVHYWNADESLLTEMLVSAGFRNVKRIQYHPSLIIEGIK